MKCPFCGSGRVKFVASDRVSGGELDDVDTFVCENCGRRFVGCEVRKENLHRLLGFHAKYIALEYMQYHLERTLSDVYYYVLQPVVTSAMFYDLSKEKRAELYDLVNHYKELAEELNKTLSFIRAILAGKEDELIKEVSGYMEVAVS